MSALDRAFAETLPPGLRQLFEAAERSGGDLGETASAVGAWPIALLPMIIAIIEQLIAKLGGMQQKARRRPMLPPPGMAPLPFPHGRNRFPHPVPFSGPGHVVDTRPAIPGIQPADLLPRVPGMQAVRDFSPLPGVQPFPGHRGDQGEGDYGEHDVESLKQMGRQQFAQGMALANNLIRTGDIGDVGDLPAPVAIGLAYGLGDQSFNGDVIGAAANAAAQGAFDGAVDEKLGDFGDVVRSALGAVDMNVGEEDITVDFTRALSKIQEWLDSELASSSNRGEGDISSAVKSVALEIPFVKKAIDLLRRVRTKLESPRTSYDSARVHGWEWLAKEFDRQMHIARVAEEAADMASSTMYAGISGIVPPPFAARSGYPRTASARRNVETMQSHSAWEDFVNIGFAGDNPFPTVNVVAGPATIPVGTPVDLVCDGPGGEANYPIRGEVLVQAVLPVSNNFGTPIVIGIPTSQLALRSGRQAIAFSKIPHFVRGLVTAPPIGGLTSSWGITCSSLKAGPNGATISQFAEGGVILADALAAGQSQRIWTALPAAGNPTYNVAPADWVLPMSRERLIGEDQYIIWVVNAVSTDGNGVRATTPQNLAIHWVDAEAAQPLLLAQGFVARSVNPLTWKSQYAARQTAWIQEAARTLGAGIVVGSPDVDPARILSQTTRALSI
jgi:hypothetical protein